MLTLSTPRCIAGYYFQVVLITVFSISSDIFITLRCAAFTRIPQPADMVSSQDVCDNIQKQDTWVYFGTLVLARLIISLVSSLVKHPTGLIYDIPVDPFNLCKAVINL